MGEQRLTPQHWLGIIFLTTVIPVLIWVASIFSEEGVKSGPVTEAATDSFLPIKHWTLENGASVHFVQVNTLPIIDIWVAFNAGSARDSLPGQGQLVHNLYKRQTKTLSANELATKLDAIGTELHSNYTEDASIYHLRTLSDHETLSSTLEVLRSMLSEPETTEEAFSALRNKQVIQLHSSLNRPAYTMDKALAEAFYPEHPYGHLPLGTEEALQKIALRDVIDFRDRYYVPANAHIVVVGDLSPGELDEKLRRSFEGIKPGVAAPHLPKVEPPTALNRHIEFGSEQTHIRMGFPIQAKGDPDYFALKIATDILGGGMTSRLFKEIRVKEGYAYSVSANVDPRAVLGPLEISLETRKDQAAPALKKVKQIYDEYIRSGPTTQEIASSKAMMTGKYPIFFSNNMWIAQLVLDMALYDLPLDYYNTYLERLSEVTDEDVKRVIETRMATGELVVLTLGSEKPK